MAVSFNQTVFDMLSLVDVLSARSRSLTNCDLNQAFKDTMLREGTAQCLLLNPPRVIAPEPSSG